MVSKMRNSRMIFVMVAALVLTAICPVEAGAKGRLMLNRKKVTLYEGKSCVLKVKGTKNKVRWSTAKKKIATVTRTGKVKAKKAGKVNITAKVERKKLVCRVTVKKKKPDTGGDKKPGTDLPEHTGISISPQPTAGITIHTANPAVSPDRSPGPEKTPEPHGTPAVQTPESTAGTRPEKTQEPVKTPTPTPVKTAEPVPTEEPQKVPEEFYQTSQPAYVSGQPEAPVLSADSGVYGKAFFLGMRCQPGTKIYYTTDGSMPSAENGSEYTAAVVVANRNGLPNVLSAAANIKKMYISNSGYDYVPQASEVAKCTVIRAAAVSPDGQVSDVVTRSYFVGNDVKKKYAGASVISLVIDPESLLNADTGIHVLGNKYEEWRKTEEGSKIDGSRQYWDYEGNYTQSGRDWERRAAIDYLDADSEKLEFSIPVGIRVRGGASRMYGQKGFNVYLRQEYGQKNLKYPLLPGDVDTAGNPVTKYKSFMLRNGGNDTEYSKIRDIFIQKQVSGRAYGIQAVRPCVVFINGEYWGLYNLTEKYSDHSIETNYGVLKENVVIFKENEMDEGVEGDEALYSELWSYAEKDFTDDAVYQAFCAIMDIDSFADYYATEIYIANKDWNPEKNYMLWRARTPDGTNPYADGKWRYLLYDTEYSMGLYEDGWGQKPETFDSFSQTVRNDELFAAVIKNKTFQQKFLATIREISSQNFDSAACVKSLDEYTKVYKPLMQDFYTRFFGIDTWNRNQFDSTVSSLKSFVKNRYKSIISHVERGCK